MDFSRVREKYVKSIDKLEIENGKMKVELAGQEFEGDLGLFMLKTEDGYKLGVCGRYENVENSATFYVKTQDALNDLNDDMVERKPELIKEVLEEVMGKFREELEHRLKAETGPRPGNIEGFPPLNLN